MPRFEVDATIYLTIGTKEGKPATKEEIERAMLDLEQTINNAHWYDPNGNACSPRIHVHKLKGVVKSDAEGS